MKNKRQTAEICIGRGLKKSISTLSRWAAHARCPQSGCVYEGEILGALCVSRLSCGSRSAARLSSSGSSSITCATGSWCGASRTRGTSRWPTSTRTCSARRTPGPRWAAVLHLVFTWRMLLIYQAVFLNRNVSDRLSAFSERVMWWTCVSPDWSAACKIKCLTRTQRKDLKFFGGFFWLPFFFFSTSNSKSKD